MKKIKKLFIQLFTLLMLPNRVIGLYGETRDNIDSVKLLLGKMLTVELLKRGILSNLREAEFSIFSQGGDDGILQYLTHHVADCPHVYVDIGGGNYTQPDTRFLLQNSWWKGYIIDRVDTETIKQKEFYSIYDVQRSQVFLTKENINSAMPQEELGFLNIDIDGNDYYVLEAMDARPAIIAAEYNSYFGLHPVTIAYNPAFDRMKSEFGSQYCGASLSALHHLLSNRGYVFVGCNGIGINAFFVRKDIIGNIKTVSLEEGYVEAKVKMHYHKGKPFEASAPDYVQRFFLNAPFFDVAEKKEYLGSEIFKQK